ncbi:hypothetical protein SH1V18_37060 [Vallitalea longa]|uniref:Uncharacterized protein n=1 Tax=Vallitalea longa TaxID=2936439 RepID=A0A9W5YEJ5_9FIRM|nr:hypothetical protein [Vallitalea longa]GKX31226.1 hypothetical protein SH1V18_37060 [Vallitalea longa]
MKKFINIFMILLLVLLPVSSVNATTLDVTDSSIVELSHSYQSPPLYLIGPYPENSDIGYQEYNDGNGIYYVRVRETKLVKGPSDSDPVKHYKSFGTIYRTDGFTGRLDKSVSISDSVSTSTSDTWGVSISLGCKADIFSSSVTSNHSQTVTETVGHTVTKSYSEGYTYGFPLATAPAECTKAEMGIGFQYQTYRSLIDVKKLVPVEKYVKIVSSQYINECSICQYYQEHGGVMPKHRHNGFVGVRYELADGSVYCIEEDMVDILIKTGTIKNGKYRKTVNEWKRETIEGTVLLPTDVMVTTYYDKNGNVIPVN